MFADHSVNVSPNAGENGSSLLPAGSMINYAGATAPAGWLMCDGTAYSRSVYATLFKVLGTSYGVGDGSTTFNVPNTAGKTIRGVNGSYLLGQSGGAESVVISADNLPQHRHGYNLAAGTGYTAADGSTGNRASQTQNYTNADQTYLNSSNTLTTNSAVAIVNTYVAVPFIIRAF